MKKDIGDPKETRVGAACGVHRPPVTTSGAKKKETTGEMRGEVLAVVRALLEEGRPEEVLGVVSQLVAKNSELAVQNAELERRLNQLLAYRRKNEGISTEQLLLFLNELTHASANNAVEDDGPLSSEMIEANTKLLDASKVDDEPEPMTRPKRQPALRKPLPEHFPRVDNVIRVPEQDRACPKCSKERTCIGHDVTEVAELVPAQVIVRRDMREKLACVDCDGEIGRAPVGDKVVAGGRLGPQLVSVLLVDKYSDGLPLHRQKERFARMGLSLSVSTLADQVTWSTDLLRPVCAQRLQRCSRAR